MLGNKEELGDEQGSDNRSRKRDEPTQSPDKGIICRKDNSKDLDTPALRSQSGASSSKKKSASKHSLCNMWPALTLLGFTNHRSSSINDVALSSATPTLSQVSTGSRSMGLHNLQVRLSSTWFLESPRISDTPVVSPQEICPQTTARNHGVENKIHYGYYCQGDER
jgi:hypothetical protein